MLGAPRKRAVILAHGRFATQSEIQRTSLKLAEECAAANLSLRWSRLFRTTKHQIQVLNPHAGCAFAEIVEPGHKQDVPRLVRQDAQGDAVGFVKSLWLEANLVSVAGIAQRFNFDELFVVVTRR